VGRGQDVPQQTLTVFRCQSRLWVKELELAILSHARRAAAAEQEVRGLDLDQPIEGFLEAFHAGANVLTGSMSLQGSSRAGRRMSVPTASAMSRFQTRRRRAKRGAPWGRFVPSQVGTAASCDPFGASIRLARVLRRPLSRDEWRGKAPLADRTSARLPISKIMDATLRPRAPAPGFAVPQGEMARPLALPTWLIDRCGRRSLGVVPRTKSGHRNHQRDAW